MPSTSSTLAEQAEALRAASAGHLPPEVVTVFNTSVARLRDAGVPADVATPGTEVADVDLLDAHGEPTSLYEVTGGRPAVVVLYRGVWCPYCNLALKNYGEQLPGPLTERGVALIAVSPQKPDGSLSMQEKHDLQFPVMSDPGNALAAQLGVLMASAGEDVLSAQRQLGLDLTAVNADGTEGLPMPTVVVIDSEHRIGWIDVHPDYGTRTEVADILNAVDTSEAGGSPSQR
jgi:peroxiredoxin